MGNLIVKAFLGYIEKNPDVIEKLVEMLIKELLSHAQDTQKS